MDSVKRIYSPNNNLTEEDMLDLARLLVKAGYTVKKGKQKSKTDGKLVKFIEYGIEMEESNNE